MTNSNLGDSANTNSNFGSLASKDGINFKAVLSGDENTQVATQNTQNAQNTEFINQPSDEIIKNTLEYYQQDNSQNAHAKKPKSIEFRQEMGWQETPFMSMRKKIRGAGGQEFEIFLVAPYGGGGKGGRIGGGRGGGAGKTGGSGKNGGVNNTLTNQTYTGGAYKDIQANGGQVHHMPADSVSPFSKGKGPGIRMDTEDHRKTESWGNSNASKVYRSKQKELIDNGSFKEAQKMDIDDVRSKFGTKYDDAIRQMLDYTNKLLKLLK